MKNCDMFSYLCSKHRLWVLVRTEAVLTCTTDLCFRAHLRIKCIPLKLKLFDIDMITPLVSMSSSQIIDLLDSCFPWAQVSKCVCNFCGEE